MVAASSTKKSSDYAPAPRLIRSTTAEIRAQWSEEERRRRSSLARVYRLLLVESIGDSLCHSSVEQ